MQENRAQGFFTPGTFILLAVMAVGYLFGLARMITGLGGVTNLSDQYPWGLWIGVDVASGVESEPGVKDAGRLAAFMAAVRGAEAGFAGDPRRRGPDGDAA